MAIFWFESVNFQSTLFDTSDLSTIRGGSLACLQAAKDIETFIKEKNDNLTISVITTGASRAILEITNGEEEEITKAVNCALKNFSKETNLNKLTSQTKAALEGRGELTEKPYEFLHFVHGLSFNNNKDTALKESEAIAKQQQLKQISISGISETTGKAPCAIDHKRPTTEEIYVANFDNYTEADNSTKISVSKSVAARRSFGRGQRQAFYKSIIPDIETDAFCDSFQDIIAAPPPHIPLSVRNKIAVFYADGNKFGEMIKNIQTNGNDNSQIAKIKYFSEKLLNLQNETLMKQLLNIFTTKKLTDQKANAFWTDKNDDRIRFETLLWGGDEVRFVMPAWIGLEFAQTFMNCVSEDNWKIGEQKLTFSASLVMASSKTPIRQLIKFGEDLVDYAKNTGEIYENKMIIQTLESLEPPSNNLSSWWSARFGVDNPDTKKLVLRYNDTNSDPIKFFDSLKQKELLPRSQIYRFLDIAYINKSFATAKNNTDTDQNNSIEKAIEIYAKKAGKGKKIIPKDFIYPESSLSFSIFLLTRLWDYLPSNIIQGEQS